MSPEEHFNLGLQLASAGKRDEAMGHYRQVLRLKPDHAGACTNLGIGLAEQGKLEEALAALREAVRLKPDFAKAHHNLGVALAQMGKQEEAEQCLRQALRLNPDYPEACYNLGNVLVSQKKRTEAVQVFQRALRLKPDSAEVYNNLGLLLTDLGRAQEAVIILQQGARLRPQSPEALNNLGLALTDLGRFAEAEQTFQEALRLNPHHAEAHSNLGSAFKEQGRLQEALTSYDLAICYEPNTPSFHWNRALTLLQKGDFEEGWREYEWRWKRPQTPPRKFRQPPWDGGDLTGRTILLWMEQGLGDMIQFIRYASLVKERGGKVLVECPGSLIPLFSTCPGIDNLIAEGTALPAFDAHAPLMSLPWVCGTTLATIPATVPYLSAKADRVEKWHTIIRGQGLAVREQGAEERPSNTGSSLTLDPCPLTPFLIGIAWQGNIYHKRDHHRSIPLTEFAPLVQLPGVQLISLQKGQATEQLRACAGRLNIIEPSGEVDPVPASFADTAAIMQNLDLVITADTAIAHLAGALGVKVWVGLSLMADWRWMMRANDTPWYPTMRLFRQTKLGDWGDVIERMVQEIHSITKTRKSETGNRVG